MALAVIPFHPSASAAPRLSMTFDSLPYLMTVTWNVAAQRYYVNLYDGFGVWIMTQALIETGPGQKIYSVVYERKLRAMRVTLLTPRWRPLGQMVDFWLEGVEPEWLNGKHRSEIISPTEFLFSARNPAVTFDPGQIQHTGTANRFVNLVEGYIDTNVVIFRNNQFEVF